MERPQIGLAHQTSDAMLAASFAAFSQIEKDTRGAVDALGRREGCANQTEQPSVLLRAVRDGLLAPCVVATRSDVEDAAHHLHAVLAAMRLNERVQGSNPLCTGATGHRHRPPWLMLHVH